MDGKNAAKIYRRDRRNHASPNSAQTEAAMAGALDVQLAGNACYFGKLYEKPTIGDPIRAVEPEDIRRSNRLMYGTAILGILICLYHSYRRRVLDTVIHTTGQQRRNEMKHVHGGNIYTYKNCTGFFCKL